MVSALLNLSLRYSRKSEEKRKTHKRERGKERRRKKEREKMSREEEEYLGRRMNGG